MGLQCNDRAMIDRSKLLEAFDGLLGPERFRDYGPNGLQVEGRAQVRRLVSGVTASQALIEAAAGWMKQRLAALLANDINLFAYHLPLDAHPELGNNAQLGRQLGWVPQARFGEQDLGMIGQRADGGSFERAQALADHVAQCLGRAVTCVDGGRPIRRVAWCTGGAQGYFEAAIAAGADAFLTGEISEPQTHYARECGVTFLAAGHHATERYGAPAVAAHVAAALGLEHQFIDIDNPA
jgi:dinuclear metal center YbgI/SA1388 family protein